ncbi:MAG TPA: PDZ domain-containing protein [Vicinamibacterales bacterium]|nr:PDZ domain-containing protein [Vicinamibacterales bacterium]
MKRVTLVLSLVLAAVIPNSRPNAQAPPPVLAQQPALSATQVAFVFAGDLWSVPRAGGEARRLTTGSGVESSPRFSPDGKWIAFTGQYDGNVDVFVMPAEGGVPRRLTWHPDVDTALGWTRDGKRVLFSSTRTSYSRFRELFVVPLEGGLAEKLPLPMGFEGAFSPDGGRLAYVPLPRAFTAWKRYRGGQATPVWIASLSTSAVEQIPREGSNDYDPMWIDEKVYFLSDRSEPVTLYSYDTKTKQVTQAVRNTGMDFKSASAGPGGIVIEQFGQLQLFDPASSGLTPIAIRIAGDIAEMRPRYINVSRRLTNAHISPTGARALFEARGEILTVPAEKGDTRNLTSTPGVMERDPAWSPDGQSIAYFSDESGEYELHVKDSMGRSPAKKIRLEQKPTFYLMPRWSPDSRKIAYLDAHLNTWYVDIDQQKPVRIDKDRYLFPSGQRVPVWSPDSRWIAYSKRLPNYLSTIFVHSVADGKSYQLTDGLSDARYPVFDRDGKYLYFTASTDSGPTLEPDVRSGSRTTTRSIYATVLSKTEASPFAPESDEEKVVKPGEKPSSSGTPEAKSEEKQPEAGGEETSKPAPAAGGAKVPEVRIDFDRINQRILAVPMPARSYVGLQVGRAGTLFALEAPPASGGPPPGLVVHRYDLRQRRSDVLISGVRFFEASANGEKSLTAQGDRWTIQNVRPLPPASGGGNQAGPPSGPGGPPGGAGGGPQGGGPGTFTLRTEDIELRSDPGVEWKQMYHDAWRIQREFFYDPALHGLDLAAAIRKYEPYLASVQSRRDLNYVFADMMGEITVGHLGVGGGDVPEVKTIQTGLLGADYRIENGRYRFARIFDGENWNPDLKAPLTQPGVNVEEGEYLLSVNGRDVRATDSVYSFFEATAGKSVLLRVGPNPDGSGSREVTVIPVPNESRLRNLAWIEGNRRKVDDATNGRVAYVYMPDTAFGGYTNFTRYFYAQVGKEAVIIDERFNGGGALATDIIEHLKRTMMSLVATRDGEDEVQPQGAIFGPKVMIINEFAGSGGDAMPNYFRRAGVGRLIGKRTWGGLVGRAGAPPLMDGGFVSAPSSAVWGPEGQWDAENVGIAPDIEVEHDPALVRQGKDPQLERAIAEVMEELKKNPVPKPKRPAYPNYHKKATTATSSQ